MMAGEGGYAMRFNALSLFILNINLEGLCQIQTKCSELVFLVITLEFIIYHGNNLTQRRNGMMLTEQIEKVILEKVLLCISSGTCFLFFCWILDGLRKCVLKCLLCFMFSLFLYSQTLLEYCLLV